MHELATIDITQIDVVDGHNPRGPIDADQLQPLADEASQTETRRKDGSLSKVTHLRTTTDCRNVVEAFLDRAETPEQIYGALVQLIVATQYADPNAAPTSDRFGELRGVRYSGRAKGLTTAIDTVAKAVLPDDLRKKVQRRR